MAICQNMWTLKHFMFVFANVILAQGRRQHQSDIATEFFSVNAQQILSSLLLSVASDRAGRLPPTTLLCLLSICPLPLLQSNNNRVNIGMTLTVFLCWQLRRQQFAKWQLLHPLLLRERVQKEGGIGGGMQMEWAKTPLRRLTAHTGCFKGVIYFPKSYFTYARMTWNWHIIYISILNLYKQSEKSSNLIL